jgi:hypothetical protein
MSMYEPWKLTDARPLNPFLVGRRETDRHRRLPTVFGLSKPHRRADAIAAVVDLCKPLVAMVAECRLRVRKRAGAVQTPALRLRVNYSGPDLHGPQIATVAARSCFSGPTGICTGLRYGCVVRSLLRL